MLSFLTRLADAADRPGFNWKGLVLSFTVGQYLFSNYLSVRQYKVLCKPSPPVELAEQLKKDTFQKTQEYGRAKARFGFFTSFYGLVQNLAIIHYDLLPKIYHLAGSLVLQYGPKWFQGATATSIVFMMLFQIGGSLLELPVSLYQTFVLEEKFGFNKQTFGLFISDVLKTQALSVVIGVPLLWGMLKVITYFGDNFFYYLWLFFFGFQIIAMTVFPTLIQPLFNKLTPLEDGELKTSVEDLAKSVKFPLKRLYVIDGSKRSSHSNAYFFGMPWSKQIVIYDTLIEKSNTRQVTAVLAHEIGHWAMSHTTKMLVILQSHLFSIFALFSVFIKNKSLYHSFGFYNEYPILVGFLLFNDILQPIDSVMTFVMNLLSRKHEYEADAYAAKLDFGTDLAQSLISIHEENLSSVDADYWYSAYHHSHPILPERLRALRSYQVKKD